MTQLICPACGYDGAFLAHGRYHETFYPKYGWTENTEQDAVENYTCTKCDYYGTADEFEPVTEEQWNQTVSPALLKRIRSTE